jgi:adenylate kinase family enzyme
MEKKRVFILGTVGSGKTSLARELSKKLNIKHYDLDDIFWTKRFNKKRDEKQRNKLLKNIISKKKWIIEGVYTDWIEEGIKKSDDVIILDIPFRSLFYRITKRTLKKEKSKEKGEEKYKENLRGFLGLIKSAIRYKGGSRAYYKHKKMIDKYKVNFIILRSKKQINKFLEVSNGKKI